MKLLMLMLENVSCLISLYFTVALFEDLLSFDCFLAVKLKSPSTLIYINCNRDLRKSACSWCATASSF